MCVKACDVTLGDFDNPCCSLYDEHSMFEYVCENLENLHDPALDGLDDQQLYDVLYAKLYAIGDATTSEEQLTKPGRYQKFDFLTNWGESFDGFVPCFILLHEASQLKILFPSPEGTGCHKKRIRASG